MWDKSLLRSENLAWAVGAILLFGISLFAYIKIGWLGIGIIGLIGLLISTTVALHGGHAVISSGHGSYDAQLYARQLEEERKSQTSPEQKKAAAARKAKRLTVLYLINTAFIGMALLGFGLFFLVDI